MVENEVAADCLLGVIVLLGASVQLLAGIGLALAAAPALVLLEGLARGVLLANCLTCAISAVGLASEWRKVRLTSIGPLVLAAVCTVPVGAWVTARLPTPMLLVSIGTVVTGAALAVARGARLPALRGLKGGLAAGAASGLINSSAGVGGPALSLYAVNDGWPAREFVPNALFYGVVINGLSIVMQGGPPALTAPAWASISSGLIGGALTGKVLSRTVSEAWARRIVLLLAMTGGLTTLGKGIWGM